MKASQRGYTAIVELLLEAGASKNAKDKVRAQEKLQYLRLYTRSQITLCVSILFQSLSLPPPPFILAHPFGACSFVCHYPPLFLASFAYFCNDAYFFFTLSSYYRHLVFFASCYSFFFTT